MLGSFSAPILLSTLVSAGTPYQVDFAADGTATAAMLGMLLLVDATIKPAFPIEPACGSLAEPTLCPKANLNLLDQQAVGLNSKAWRTTSDFGQIFALGLPIVATAWDSAISGSDHALRDGFTDSLVMAEAVAAASLLSQGLKFAVRRPRPSNYFGEPQATSLERKLSFPSGHVTAAASAAAAYSTTFALRHPKSPWRWAVISGGVGLTTLVALGRVEGGMHFPTDVLAGALLGGTVGFLVPYLHRRNVALTNLNSSLDGQQVYRGLVLAMRF